MTTGTPALQGTDTAASPVTTPTTDATPPADKVQAGIPPGQNQGGERAEGASDQSQETPRDDQDADKPKTGKEKRQERNRQRWQEFQEAKAYRDNRMAMLEAEVARLRSTAPPDFSKIGDPQEELAERTAWKITERQRVEAEQRLRMERDASGEVEQTKLLQAWEEQREAARERLPDFDSVVTEQTPIHQRAAAYIVESDKGADIAYFLGKNPREARALYDEFSRNPAKAFIELGRIEERLTAPKPKTVSTAPKPATTLTGGANPLQFDVSRASVSDMSAQLKKAGVLR